MAEMTKDEFKAQLQKQVDANKEIRDTFNEHMVKGNHEICKNIFNEMIDRYIKIVEKKIKGL